MPYSRPSPENYIDVSGNQSGISINYFCKWQNLFINRLILETYDNVFTDDVCEHAINSFKLWCTFLIFVLVKQQF